ETHTRQSRHTPSGTQGPADGGRRALERCEKMLRRRDTYRGALDTPATLAACCGGRQASPQLDAGRAPELGDRHIAYTAQRVRDAPSVGDAPDRKSTRLNSSHLGIS